MIHHHILRVTRLIFISNVHDCCLIRVRVVLLRGCYHNIILTVCFSPLFVSRPSIRTFDHSRKKSVDHDKKMPLKKREWVRSFEIGPATPSLKSKVVLYQVTSLIFPVGFPEAATKLVVRKKFSDFQQLHKALSEIHKNLYLKGKFPVLPKFNKGYFKSSENAGSILLI